MIYERDSISEEIASSLTGTIGVLLQAPVHNQTDDLKIYLPRQNSLHAQNFKRHMAAAYHGFLLQLRLDKIDSGRTNVQRILQLIPAPRRNFFMEYLGQLEAGTEVHSSGYYSEAYTIYAAALVRLSHLRAASLEGINRNAFGGLPFAHVQTHWAYAIHPEVIWRILCRTYGLAENLASGGIDLDGNMLFALLEASHLLAVEADVIGQL